MAVVAGAISDGQICRGMVLAGLYPAERLDFSAPNRNTVGKPTADRTTVAANHGCSNHLAICRYRSSSTWRHWDQYCNCGGGKGHRKHRAAGVAAKHKRKVEA